jgi:hypothetical protein
MCKTVINAGISMFIIIITLHETGDIKKGLDHGAQAGSGVPAVNMEMALDRMKELVGVTVGKKKKQAVLSLAGISTISH